VDTICIFCGCGCGITYGARGGRIVSAEGTRHNPVNRGSLCVKGRFGFEYINSPERLASPMIKKNGAFEKATWDEALDLVAEKFKSYRGEGFATVASAKATNEENYILSKFTRAVMGTNNIDHCARI
jgi:formate dehydrogenase major subunit